MKYGNGIVMTLDVKRSMGPELLWELKRDMSIIAKSILSHSILPIKGS